MKLHVREEGSGERIAILIHGGTGDSGTWFDTTPTLLEKGYKVLMPDLRGHGESPWADSYTQEDFADDLVESLPVGADVIMGHSLGGRALVLAVDRLRPKRAIYLDPGWIIPEVPDEENTPIRRDGSIATADEYQQMNPRWPRAHIEQSLASLAKFDRRIIPVNRIQLDDYYPPVPPVVPSLVVLADPSPLVPPSEEERLKAGGYELRTVKGSGHVLFADDHEGYLRSLEGWI